MTYHPVGDNLPFDPSSELDEEPTAEPATEGAADAPPPSLWGPQADPAGVGAPPLAPEMSAPAGVAPPPPSGRSGRHRFAATLAALALVGTGTGVGIGYSVFSSAGTGVETSSAVTTAASVVDPGLVDIDTVLGDETAEAAGTGMVLTSTGLVLTNNHVIEGATSITVTDVGNHKSYRATVVGYDTSADVAVIKLTGASGLTTVTTDTSAAAVGEEVEGIGNAGGTGGTPHVAQGTVTALSQSITASDELSSRTEQLRGLIETNANIEAGDSGGPLVNAAGEVIGMDTAASSSGSFRFDAAGAGNDETQGYAIPIATALAIAREIEAGDASSSVHIGTTAFLGVGVEATVGGQLAVVEVKSGSPAARAGIEPGDVITAIGSDAVTSATTLAEAIATHLVGDSVTVTWETSSASSQTATVTLVSGPAG